MTYDDDIASTPVRRPPSRPGAAPWRTIYAVDLRNRGSQAVALQGSVMLDAKTWRLKASSGDLRVTGAVAPEGLALTTTMDTDAFPALTCAHWVCRLSQIADYNPAAPTAVWMRAARLTIGRANLGVISAADTGAAITVVELDGYVASSRKANAVATQFETWGGNTQGAYTVSPMPAHGAFASCIVRVGPGLYTRTIADWSEGWAPPSPTTTPLRGTNNYGPNGPTWETAEWSTSDLAAVFFAMSDGTSTSCTHYLTHLWVQQPGQ